MREIVVISGKGGTGKTSLSASFAYLEGQNAITADCDVDAANMHILLDADFSNRQDFFSGEVAYIDSDKCIDCGKCKTVCRFDAILLKENRHTIDRISCEGCGYCARVCPSGAITMLKQKAGDIFVSNIKNGATMVHAKLGFAAENSGKLVAKVKQEAKILALKEDREFVITDGSPGIGCPVISSLSGANLVVLVTEATVSGLHDLKRVVELLKTFSLQAVCIINKYDLNEEMNKMIEEYLGTQDIEVIARLGYDETFAHALIEAKPIVEYSAQSQLSRIIKESWEKIKTKIRNQK
jgi:MinD superfamily P-loop ATPase